MNVAEAIAKVKELDKEFIKLIEEDLSNDPLTATFQISAAQITKAGIYSELAPKLAQALEIALNHLVYCSGCGKYGCDSAVGYPTIQKITAIFSGPK